MLRRVLAQGFSVVPAGTRVEFGAKALERLPTLVAECGAQRVLVIASERRGNLVARVRDLLGERVVAVDHRTAMHVPVDIADAVSDHAARIGADLILAIGGGSAIGVAKAVALASGPPYIAVPTTYSGSEMTAIWGTTRDGAKQTGRDERVRARAVIYDPLLTHDVPARVSVPSGINALAHCLEALYAPGADPTVLLSAAEGARALVASLPVLAREPHDPDARAEALYGAWLGGYALGNAAMGLHHKLCHVLGGSFGLPHAETHAILLAHTIGYNAPAAPEAMKAAAGAMGIADPRGVPPALHALTRGLLTAVGAPLTLGALGFRGEQLERAARLAMMAPYANPAPLELDAVVALLSRAADGAPPA
jgi:maleylacetate reductase